MIKFIEKKFSIAAVPKVISCWANQYKRKQHCLERMNVVMWYIASLQQNHCDELVTPQKVFNWQSPKQQRYKIDCVLGQALGYIEE